jgi:hypothetical protein
MDSLAGRPTSLTPELTLKIRKLVLDNVSYENIKQILEISDGTWDTWIYKNYMDFRTDLFNWKKERIIKKSEKTLEALVEADDDRIRLDASKFMLETLGKDVGYSKRSELTGKDGKDLPTPILGNVPTDNINKESIDPQKQD